MTPDIGDGLAFRLHCEQQARADAEDRARRYLLLITAAVLRIHHLTARLRRYEENP